MAFQNWSCFLPSLTPFPTFSLELAGSFRFLQEAVSAAVHERVRLVQTQSSCATHLRRMHVVLPGHTGRQTDPSPPPTQSIAEVGRPQPLVCSVVSQAH